MTYYSIEIYKYGINKINIVSNMFLIHKSKALALNVTKKSQTLRNANVRCTKTIEKNPPLF